MNRKSVKILLFLIVIYVMAALLPAIPVLLGVLAAQY